MNKKGFTLIEIIVTAIIVGALGMMAIPDMLKMVNSSYAQDAFHNLSAIYAAEQSYAQNNGDAYLDAANLAAVNAGLGLNIISNGNIDYSCGSVLLGVDNNTHKVCQAVKGGSSGMFDMLMILDFPVSNTTPQYCDNANFKNPCCDEHTSGANLTGNCPH